MTQAWLAAGDAAAVASTHFYHQRPRTTPVEAQSPAHQDALLDYCAHLTQTTLSAA
ncbi:MAG TPA: hypothetical protein VH141_05450 [Pseudonocardia sp.]|nr:hypothetical protein [Pseudonocardia sp.]